MTATTRSGIAEPVSARTSALQASLHFGDPGARAALSSLRLALRNKPGATPSAWADTIGLVPPQLRGQGTDITRHEWAVHIAMSTFAVHVQRSLRARAHTQADDGWGPSLAHAVSRLRNDRGRIVPGAESRFYRLLAARTHPARAQHLRGLMGLIASHGVALNYGLLADQLSMLGDRRLGAQVRMSWARDLATYTHPQSA